jgi:hypothetical protein
MRESAPCLDLEQAKLVPTFQVIANKCGELPSLRGVQVYVAGVDGIGKSMAYWQSLCSFRTVYLHKSGAILENFSVLREIELSK